MVTLTSIGHPCIRYAQERDLGVCDRETIEWNTMTTAHYMTVRLICMLQLEFASLFFALDWQKFEGALYLPFHEPFL